MIHYIDALEVIAAAHGKPEPDEDSDYETLREFVADEYGLGLDELCTLLTKLAPLCAKAKGNFTGKHYAGFAKDGVFLAKVEIEEAG